MIKNYWKAAGWTPIENGLPHIRRFSDDMIVSANLLISTIYMDKRIAFYHKNSNRWICENGDKLKTAEVTAWMPLPPTYEENT